MRKVLISKQYFSLTENAYIYLQNSGLKMSELYEGYHRDNPTLIEYFEKQGQTISLNNNDLIIIEIPKEIKYKVRSSGIMFGEYIEEVITPRVWRAVDCYNLNNMI